MKTEFKFRHLPHAPDLERYVTTHLDKITRYEIKPSRAEFTFSIEKSGPSVDLHVRGEGLDLHARGEAEDFTKGVDLALEKMARQMAKQKAKIQRRGA